jgi:hypothetical protein
MPVRRADNNVFDNTQRQTSLWVVQLIDKHVRQDMQGSGRLVGEFKG